MKTKKAERETPPTVELTGVPEIDSMIVSCIETFRTKGVEYRAGSTDILANFRTVSDEADVPPEKVWFTYFYKHYAALSSFIKTKKVLSEPIRGRIMDMIVYLLLFTEMVAVDGMERPAEEDDVPDEPIRVHRGYQGRP